MVVYAPYIKTISLHICRALIFSNFVKINFPDILPSGKFAELEKSFHKYGINNHCFTKYWKTYGGKTKSDKKGLNTTRYQVSPGKIALPSRTSFQGVSLDKSESAKTRARRASTLERSLSLEPDLLFSKKIINHLWLACVCVRASRSWFLLKVASKNSGGGGGGGGFY